MAGVKTRATLLSVSVSVRCESGLGEQACLMQRAPTVVAAGGLVARQAGASSGVPDAEGQPSAAGDGVRQSLRRTFEGTVSAKVIRGTNCRGKGEISNCY